MQILLRLDRRKVLLSVGEAWWERGRSVVGAWHKRGSIIRRLHHDVTTIMKILPRCFHDASTLMPILLRSYHAFTPIHFSHAPATLVLNMFKISVAGSWSFTIFAILLRPYHVHEDPLPMGHDDTTIGHDSVPN